jgi:uncharacterized protein DUF3551
MAKIGILAALVASLFAVTGARAEIDYPYCIGVNGGYGSGFESCGFTTMAQCRETVLGMGGWCYANPRYSVRREPAADGRSRRGASRRPPGS